MSGAAPYYAEVAAGPADGRAFWLTTGDGRRIRVARWGDTAERGTVLLFPGRTEYAEKYGPAAAEFLARGYATLAVDWRGQGLADRIAPNPLQGHVGRFSDYQQDVAAVVAFAREAGLPQPWYLVAHSMGGAIGLRALSDGLPVRAALFTAPMWGIQMSAALRPVAWSLSAASRPLRFGLAFAPGHGPESYVAEAEFEGNTLTHDREMFDFMRAQVRAHAELLLGGPSLVWLHESLLELRRLQALAPPELPVVTMLGSEESIVDSRAVRRRMAIWPGATLIEVPGARHELMMERPEVRAQVFDTAAALFRRSGA